MRPAVTVLQLDTQFPRIPGDVACPETYLDKIEIIRIPKASVSHIVTEDPNQIDIQPFITAMQASKGDIITTSCGFLASRQKDLQSVSMRPVLASALVSLPRLAAIKQSISVLTFDHKKLISGQVKLLKNHVKQVIGLHSETHLRNVIELDSLTLDQHKAGSEIKTIIETELAPTCKCLLMECTNLPPYKSVIREAFKGSISDILTEIEFLRPGTINPTVL